MRASMRAWARATAVRACFALFVTGAAWGTPIEDDPDIGALSNLSMEELLDVEVTSVSKRTEPRTRAAAAIYVITSEDIRRSPARTIPDLLRTVPGLHVAKLDGNKWSVASRGFGGRFSNKLLVLLDGRSVYTPVFSGVYWETLVTPLADIDRIEIIRGPGGTLWGANAVNGVINIVTKDAEATQGGLLEVGGGTEVQGFGTLRYGGRLSDSAFYRVYAEHYRWDDQGGTPVENANDRWSRTDVGFRIDWSPTELDRWTFIANAHESTVHDTAVLSTTIPPYSRYIDANPRYEDYDGTIRWKRTLSEDSAFQLSLSASLSRPDFDPLTERIGILDIEAQHQFSPNVRHSIVWGLGFRYTDMDFETNQSSNFEDDSPRSRLFSAFLQDSIELRSNLRLTLGAKVEYNDYTGLEFQPNARIAWTPSERTTLWGAVSRAVRTPAQSEQDVQFLALRGPAFRVVVEGNKEYDSETVLSYELGIRRVLTERFAVDVALFYNDYKDLRTAEVNAPYSRFFGLNPEIVLPFRGANNADGRTYGVEVGADWQVREWWSLRAAYSFLDVNLDLHPKTFVIYSDTPEGDTPSHQASLQSAMTLPHGFELDATLRYVGGLDAFDVDQYVTLDARLGWRVRENLELSLIGTDLLESDHLEYRSSIINTVPTKQQRGIYGKVSWSF